MKNTHYYPQQPHNVPMAKDRYGNTYYIDCNYTMDTDDIFLSVERGFRYDGASIPRLAWTLSGLHPDGLLRAAALVHDIIYIQNGYCTKIVPSSYYNLRFKKKLNYTRKDADKLFYKMLRESGLGKFKSWICYQGVRIGGRFYREF